MGDGLENPAEEMGKNFLEKAFGKQLSDLRKDLEKFQSDPLGTLLGKLKEWLGLGEKVTEETQKELGRVRLEAISGLRGRVVAEARKHVGKRETSHNAGPDIAEFTLGKVEPWCADFVSYVLMKAGVPIKCGEFGWKVASTKTLMDYFIDEKRWVNMNEVGDDSSLSACVKPGDVIVWRFGNASGEGTSGHTEIVEKVDTTSGVIETIGGNTSGPESAGKPDSVAVKKHKIADLRNEARKGTVGFGVLTNDAHVA